MSLTYEHNFSSYMLHDIQHESIDNLNIKKY